jgi:hypothetical protein
MIPTDSALASLKGALNRWELFEYASTAVLGLGCIGEFLAEFTVVPRDETGKHKLARLSLIVLILGIAGELLGTVRTNQLSGQLIASIEERAGNAEQRAGEANERASANEKEAARLRLQVEQEKIARLQLEKYAAWRHLNRGNFLSALRRKPKPVSVTIVYIKDGPETWKLSQEIYRLLLEADWPAKFPEPIQPNQSRLFAGLPSIMGVGGNPFGGIALVANEFRTYPPEDKTAFAALTNAFLNGLGGQKTSVSFDESPFLSLHLCRGLESVFAMTYPFPEMSNGSRVVENEFCDLICKPDEKRQME